MCLLLLHLCLVGSLWWFRASLTSLGDIFRNVSSVLTKTGNVAVESTSPVATYSSLSSLVAYAYCSCYRVLRVLAMLMVLSKHLALIEFHPLSIRPTHRSITQLLTEWRNKLSSLQPLRTTLCADTEQQNGPQSARCNCSTSVDDSTVFAVSCDNSIEPFCWNYSTGNGARIAYNSIISTTSIAIKLVPSNLHPQQG